MELNITVNMDLLAVGAPTSEDCSPLQVRRINSLAARGEMWLDFKQVIPPSGECHMTSSMMNNGLHNGSSNKLVSKLMLMWRYIWSNKATVSWLLAKVAISLKKQNFISIVHNKYISLECLHSYLTYPHKVLHDQQTPTRPYTHNIPLIKSYTFLTYPHKVLNS